MSSQKEQDKKKKKRQSILEAELFRIMEKSLKAAMERPQKILCNRRSSTV